MSTAWRVRWKSRASPDTIWLTAQQRDDHDEAVFGELSFDITPTLTPPPAGATSAPTTASRGSSATAPGFSGSTGEAACFSDDPFHGAPCTNLDKSTSESGSLGRFNLTWKISDSKMVYATWSEGFRPGGINRRGTLPPYKSDFLTNYELGWKTTWGGNVLSWNGAVFQEDWKDFQFAYLGQNGLTEIRNAGQARIRGLETDLRWAATYNLAFTGGAAFYDAKLTENFCGWLREDGTSESVCPPGTLNPMGTFDDPTDDVAVDGPQAAAGERLPVTARFKGNLTARYTTDLWGGEGFLQAAVVHQGSRKVDLRTEAAATFGDLQGLHAGRLLGRVQARQLVGGRLPQECVRQPCAAGPVRRMQGRDLRRGAVHGRDPAAHVRRAVLAGVLTGSHAAMQNARFGGRFVFPDADVRASAVRVPAAARCTGRYGPPAPCTSRRDGCGALRRLR